MSGGNYFGRTDQVARLAGELVSFLDGRARQITFESVHGYIAPQLAAVAGTESAPQPQRGGRPRNLPRSESQA
jgi:hypothetical protein